MQIHWNQFQLAYTIIFNGYISRKHLAETSIAVSAHRTPKSVISIFFFSTCLFNWQTAEPGNQSVNFLGVARLFPRLLSAVRYWRLCPGLPSRSLLTSTLLIFSTWYSFVLDDLSWQLSQEMLSLTASADCVELVLGKMTIQICPSLNSIGFPGNDVTETQSFLMSLNLNKLPAKPSLWSSAIGDAQFQRAASQSQIAHIPSCPTICAIFFFPRITNPNIHARLIPQPERTSAVSHHRRCSWNQIRCLQSILSFISAPFSIFQWINSLPLFSPHGFE